jgi:hypothetical protein
VTSKVPAAPGSLNYLVTFRVQTTLALADEAHHHFGEPLRQKDEHGSHGDLEKRVALRREKQAFVVFSKVEQQT